jgi:hypothetical protein
VKVLFIKISDNGGVGTSSYILETFDACVEAFESITELCIGGEIGDGL